MSSNRFKRTNAAIKETPIFDRVIETFLNELDSLRLNWEDPGYIENYTPDLKEKLQSASFLQKEENGKIFLSKAGRSFFARTIIDEEQLLQERTFHNYQFLSKLGSGRESVVYLAEHSLIGRKVAIKIFYELGAAKRYQKLFESIDKSKLAPGDSIVFPSDIFSISLKDHRDDDIKLEAVVFPYRQGDTLASFLESEQPLTPFLVREFITQVGGSLADLHRAGVAHGDLHLDNIIVEASENALMRFAVLDFTGSDQSERDRAISMDWSGFKEILIYILARIPLHHMSLQRHLGARTYTLVQAVLDDRIDTTVDLDRANKDKRYYEKYKLDRDHFIEAKFNAADTIGLVRHEEITSPALARQLFVPFEPFFKEFAEFGSSILHGHRGSGKSSYVASLAMLPTSSVEFVDPRDKFGILFACRQGEFKQFRSIKLGKGGIQYSHLKHLLIVKVIRRTIEILHESLRINSLGLLADFEVESVAKFLCQVFPVGASATFESSSLERLESLYEATVRYELRFTDGVFDDNITATEGKLLNERSLGEFLQAVRDSAGVLGRTRFFLLFDDCGVPNMPEDLQRVLNELLRSANEIYCVKVTAERFSYKEEDSDGKVLEAPHDFTPFNLAESLILRGGQKIERKETRKYFEDLLSKRLETYDSNTIQSYLGQDFGTMAGFVKKISKSPKAKGAYAGWNIIWQVADRTPRHLLELVSSIFANAKVRPDTPSAIVPADIQDEAVRAYSEQKLRHIAYIPGRLDASGVTIPVGQHLSDITVAFGKYCRSSLERGRMRKSERERYYECLAIEIDRKKDLGKNADEILKLLIRYAIFDDSILALTRDGGLKQPIYVFNRIYAPVFGISVRRETHLRLWSDRFERFLLKPDTKDLSSSTVKDKNLDLFDDE